MPTEIYLSREAPVLQEGQELDTMGLAALMSLEEAACCWSAHQIWCCGRCCCTRCHAGRNLSGRSPSFFCMGRSRLKEFYQRIQQNMLLQCCWEVFKYGLDLLNKCNSFPEVCLTQGLKRSEDEKNRYCLLSWCIDSQKHQEQVQTR